MRILPRPTLFVIFSIVLVALILTACGKTTAPTPIASTQTPQLSLPSKIAFSSDRDGNVEIYTMYADGSNQTRLTNNIFYDGGPSWSSDGKKLAFITDRDGNAEIYSMDADGNHQVNLTNSTSDDTYPDWSPDMQRIVFESMRDGNWEIYVMNADGTNQIRLTDNPDDDYGARWSPDGRLIAFSSMRNGNLEVYVMNADGSNQINLSNNPAHDGSISWSGNGMKISFDTNRDGKYEIYTMNADGTNQTRLTNTAGDVGYSDWSNDGQKILFLLETQESWDIYIIDADGSNIAPLLNGPMSDYDAKWSPGSTSMAINQNGSLLAAVPSVMPTTKLVQATIAPNKKHRDVKVAYVTDPEADFPDAEMLRAFQTKVAELLNDRNISVTWVATEPGDESLLVLKSNPQDFDIVILAIGQPTTDISTALRGWLQSGGIIWAFDNGSASTWRNKELFGGVVPGADLNWEPPEEVQVMVKGLDVYPYDEGQLTANGVEGAIFVAGYPTVIFDPGTNTFNSNMTRFERALDDTTVPILKAEMVGGAVIGNQASQHPEWVVVGISKRIGKGQAVIFPFLGLDDVAAQRFEANLIEWCLDQTSK